MTALLRLTALLMVASLIFILPGCQTAAPNITNTAGTYSMLIDSTPEQVIKAGVEVIGEELKLIIVSQSATKIDGRINARTAQDVKVELTTEAQGDNVSEVNVRVGTFGDEPLSVKILQGIAAELK